MTLKYLIPLLVLAFSTFTFCRSGMSDEKAKSIAYDDATGGNYHISGTDRFSFRRFDYIGDSAKASINNSDGVLDASGHYAISSNGDTSELKIGVWTEFYSSNGSISSKGAYGIGKYVQCCFAGPCMEYYNYKLGAWEYFHPNGSIKAKGIYRLSPERIRTSCEGGAIYLESRRGKDWEYYDADGNQVEAEKEVFPDTSN